MEKIVSINEIAQRIYKMVITAPQIAKMWQPGQFLIVHLKEDSERIPLTICSRDLEKGEITLVVQAVGASTREICASQPGSYFRDVLGPLGTPSMINPDFKNLLFIAGGLGLAPLRPLIERYHELGSKTTVLVGVRTAKNLILQEEIKDIADHIMISSDDGTTGLHGLALNLVAPAVEKWGHFDHVYIAGPVKMMQYTVLETAKFGLKSTVSLNPLMIDGTGMCGGCRVSVGGHTKFACVDGPEFDGALVDFEKLSKKLNTYREHQCKLNQQFSR